MMKRSIKRILIIFVLMLLMPISVNAADQTLGDLRKEYEKVLAEKQAYDNQSAAAKKEIAEKEAASKKAAEDLNAAEAKEVEAQKKIDESNQKIEELTLESEKVLLYMQQMQGNNAYVEYVTGASSMTEMVMRMEAVKQITDYIQKTMNNLEKEIKQNKELKIELEKEQANLKAEIKKYEETIAKLYTNAQEYDKFSSSLDSKVASAKSYYETNKKMCQENIGKSDDSVKLSECSKIPANSGWLRPLTYGIITSTIGYRWGSYHNAIDIGGMREGTAIYAPAAGIVGAIEYKTSCGGNRVYIFVNVNGKQYTAYFYHLLKVNVKVGDVVDQNTIIGTVGGYSTSTAHGGYDSCTTGTHLHYGVANGFKGYHVSSNLLIPPPGFQNREGYSFNTRYI